MIEEVTPRLRRTLFVVSLPFALGLMLCLALQSRILPDPILVGQLTADLGTLIFLAGLALSGVGWIGALISWYWLRRTKQLLLNERQRQEEDHRRFIRRLDHEIKNPLATLQVSLTDVCQEVALSEQQNQTRQLAKDQVTRLRHLMYNLRKLADLDTYPLEQEPIDLAKLMHAAVAAVQETPGQREYSVSITTAPVPWSLTPVKGDRDLLMLAFYNVLGNAFKFTCSTDDIEVLIREDGSTATIDIADHGPGILEADLPHIFEELYRGERAKQVEGSGLGLALVKKIIERHDGQISVRSRVGQGTVFTMRLPLPPEEK